MPRLTFSIMPDQNRQISLSLQEDQNGIAPTYPIPLSVIPTSAFLATLRNGQSCPSLIKAVGQSIRAELDAHPEIKDRIRETFRRAGTMPIYFHLSAPESDDIPWEALYDANERFVDAVRWPIGRIKKIVGEQRRIKQEFEPPFRFLAVLAAGGVSALPEFEAICESLVGSGLPFELRVLGCEPELLQQVNALNNPRITFDWIEDESKIFTSIKRWHPRFIHFYCHGVGGSEPVLQVATRGDWRARNAGTLRISATDIVTNDMDDREQCGHCWLLTLNCCDSAGGGGTPDTANFAAAAVTKGMAATIGMRQRVTNMDAHVFARAFYKEVAHLLNDALKEGATREIDFTQATATARSAVLRELARQELKSKGVAARSSAAFAEECVEWTLPVIYSRAQPLMVTNTLRPKEIMQRKLADLLAVIPLLYGEQKRLRDLGRQDDDPELKAINEQIAKAHEDMLRQ